MRYLLLCLLLPGAALAEDCRDRIVALYSGGAMDPFARPAHSYVATTYGADGAVRWVYEGRYETALKTIGGMQGGSPILMIGSDTWTGPGIDGPWTATPNQNPPDMEAFIRGQMAQNVANLDRTRCDGMVDVDGQSLERFSWFTKTDPTEAAQGAWFGGVYTAYVDPATGLLMRLETSESVAHYQPQPGTDTQVSVYTYDPSIVIDAPQ